MMIQTLYGLIAVALSMILSLNLLRTTTGAEQRMVLNEVATHVTGIGENLMEHIGNQAFDDNTHEGKAIPQPPVFPLVTSPTMLTAEGAFGNTGDGVDCDHTTPDFYDADCDDIDDFHGMTLTREIEGVSYTATIAVRYVLVDTPDVYSGGVQTYAKEVVITVTSPYLLLGGTPLEVVLARVFSYKRIVT